MFLDAISLLSLQTLELFGCNCHINSFLLCIRTISLKVYCWKTRWITGPEEFWPQNLRFFLGEDLSCTLLAWECFGFTEGLHTNPLLDHRKFCAPGFFQVSRLESLKKKSILGGTLRNFYSLSAILKSFSLVVEKYFVMGGGQRISNKNGIREMFMVDVLSAGVQ